MIIVLDISEGMTRFLKKFASCATDITRVETYATNNASPLI